nr:hypothetical protein GCM10020093_050540 [Planobispora longispora]
MRYAFVGLGHRAQMYVDALLGDWRDTGTIVALCDTNKTRMDFYAERIGQDVPASLRTTSGRCWSCATRWSSPRWTPRTPTTSSRHWTRASA